MTTDLPISVRPVRLEGIAKYAAMLTIAGGCVGPKDQAGDEKGGILHDKRTIERE